MNTKILDTSPAALNEAAALLRRGEVVALPTETVYGLAANALDPAAVTKIFEAKGRPQDNPLIVHLSSFEEIPPLVARIPDAARTLADRFWPGPLTLIFPKSPRIPPQTSGGLDTVAIRLPAHPVAREVIARCGLPLAAPSANRSGSPSPTTAAHVRDDLDGRIAAIVDGGPCEVGVESTVLDLTGGTPRLLRPGGITLEMLRAAVGEVAVDPAVTRPLAPGAAAASPGMKYKHYAPRARVILLRGPADAYVRYVNRHAQPGVLALCFEGEETALAVPFLTYGRRDDPAAQARQVFDALRQADERDASLVYAACPSPDGVGLAVYNRLLRAAAFEVIAVD